jgi:hypothetical protein
MHLATSTDGSSLQQLSVSNFTKQELRHQKTCTSTPPSVTWSIRTIINAASKRALLEAVPIIHQRCTSLPSLHTSLVWLRWLVDLIGFFTGDIKYTWLQVSVSICWRTRATLTQVGVLEGFAHILGTTSDPQDWLAVRCPGIRSERHDCNSQPCTPSADYHRSAICICYRAALASPPRPALCHRHVRLRFRPVQ